MDGLLHTKDQRIVETVDFARATCSGNGAGYTIDWKEDGHRFAVYKECGLHHLPGEGQNGHTSSTKRNFWAELSTRKR